MKNIKFKNKTIISLFVFGILMYIFFNTKDLLTKIVVIPFIFFSLGIFLKNIFLMLGKTKSAKIMEKLYIVSFCIYYFGFLIYWDYIAIMNKDYVSLVFSLIAWFGGIFVVYRRYLKLRNK